MLGVDKNKVRQSFAAASTSYDQAAHLQREVGKALLATSQAKSLAGTVLDLGCGTGFVSVELLAHGYCSAADLIALDIALPMLTAARSKLQPSPHFVCADADHLPFADHSIQHIYSNLALQWCSQLDETSLELRRVLAPAGQLLFSTFGSKTLQELKAAWRAVDDHPHVNEFYSTEQIQAFLQQAGFTRIALQTIDYCPRYPSVVALMQELKALGAHTVAARRLHITSKTQWQAMLAAYETHRQNGFIPASFEVIMVKAQA